MPITRTQLPPGADDLMWLSACLPVAVPIIVHLIGYEQGMRLTLAYWVGHSLTRQEAEQATRKRVEILERIAASS